MNEDLLRSITKGVFEAFASIHDANAVSAGNAANNVKREDKNMSRRSITLGTWDGKPIEWLVLKEEGLATLVISRYPLLSHKFNENTNDGNRWDSSSLRKYLNNEFYKQAFNEEEKKKIVNAYLSSPNGTKDNVFVLSKEEADALMKVEEFKYSDKWCDVGGCVNCYKVLEHHKSTCCWLRTGNSDNSTYAWRMGPNDAYASGCYVDNDYSVRPSVWIKEQE